MSPGLKFPVLLAQVSIVDLQPGPLPGQAVQRLPNVGQLLLVQPPHVAHLPAFRLFFFLQLNQDGGPFAFQLLDPLDVVGEAVVEVSELIFLLDTGAAGRAGAGCGEAGGGGAAAAGGAAGAAAGGGGGGGGGGHGGGAGRGRNNPDDLVESKRHIQNYGPQEGTPNTTHTRNGCRNI